MLIFLELYFGESANIKIQYINFFLSNTVYNLTNEYLDNDNSGLSQDRTQKLDDGGLPSSKITFSEKASINPEAFEIKFMYSAIWNGVTYFVNISYRFCQRPLSKNLFLNDTCHILFYYFLLNFCQYLKSCLWANIHYRKTYFYMTPVIFYFVIFINTKFSRINNRH